jgi:hypothetical protein
MKHNLSAKLIRFKQSHKFTISLIHQLVVAIIRPTIFQVQKLKDILPQMFAIATDQQPVNLSKVTDISNIFTNLEESDPSGFKQKVETKEKPVDLRLKIERN